MSAAERLADRIVKNKQMQASVYARQGLSLDGIIAQLNRRKQRATYAAVAVLVGALPRGLMNGRAKSYADSWIVAASGSQRGWPIRSDRLRDRFAKKMTRHLFLLGCRLNRAGDFDL